MEINKHNYEEFFLLYTDNELSAAERKAVEDFVEMYPDLKEELNAVLQTRLPMEENLFSFDKTALYKTEEAGLVINAVNYESYFLLYIDNELTKEERARVEDFAATHPGKKTELDVLLRVKMQPEAETVFQNKSVLYRHEKPVIRIAFQWRRMVAAASILLIGTLVWTNFNKVKEQITPSSGRTEIASAPTDKKIETVPVGGNIINQEQAGSQQKDETSPITKDFAQKSPLVKVSQKEHRVTTIPDQKNTLESATANGKTEIQPEPVKLVVNSTQSNAIDQPVAVVEDTKMPNTLKAAVKPVILDQAAFNGDDDKDKKKEELALLDTDNTGKKSKGTFRGLFRKASRFVNRATNAGDANGDVAVVRIASFEIAKK